MFCDSKSLLPDYEVVSVGDGRALLRIVTDFQPDVVIVDIGMPVLNGLDAGRSFLRPARHRPPHAFHWPELYLDLFQKAKNKTSIYATKTADVFLISTSTIFMQTRLVPRWVALLGYSLALVLVLTAIHVRWLATVFPTVGGPRSLELLTPS